MACVPHRHRRDRGPRRGADSVAWPADDGPVPIDPGATATTLMTAEAAAAFTPTGAGSNGGDVPATSTHDRCRPLQSGSASSGRRGPRGRRITRPAPRDHRLRRLTSSWPIVDPAQPGRDRPASLAAAASSATRSPTRSTIASMPDTTPSIFGLDEIQLGRIPSLVADAPSHYDVPVPRDPRNHRPVLAVRSAGARPRLCPTHRRPHRRWLHQLHGRRHPREDLLLTGRRRATSDVALLERVLDASTPTSARRGPSSPPTDPPPLAARAGP